MSDARPAGACSITRRTVLLSPAVAVLIPVATRKDSTSIMAGSAWTNQLQNLIILAAEETGFSGFFAYDPAPGPGNLIASIAAAAGTDPYGNAYLEGVATYLPGLGTAVAMNGAFLNFYLGPPGDGTGPWVQTFQINVDRASMQMGLVAVGGLTLNGVEFTSLPGYPLAGAPSTYSPSYTADVTSLLNALIQFFGTGTP
jgi:hypothetical protein